LVAVFLTAILILPFVAVTLRIMAS
jgi:hypothetical protein